MKKTRITYWVTTIIIFLMEGLIPALTSHTELAREGISHLGYPEYFAQALLIFKVLGALALIIPQIPKRVKEWAYAGFAFEFMFAAISHGAVDGMHFQTFLPAIFLLVLACSYRAHENLGEHLPHTTGRQSKYYSGKTEVKLSQVPS